MTQFATQLIIFGKRNVEDPDGVFGEVEQSGFASIEAGNIVTAYGGSEARRLVEQYNLTLSGLHDGCNGYDDPEQLASAIEFAKAYGVKNFLNSGIFGDNSVESYKASAKKFNEFGKQTADEGITFHYHNHDFEFADLGDGVTGMDILINETDPALVKLNLDVFWLYYAEQDIAGYIRAHSDRTGYFHFKDGRIIRDEEGKKRPEFLELGQGDVDLKTAYATALEVGADWIVAEQDNTKRAPLESLTISHDYLATLAGDAIGE
ncbi:MAG: sugar phosphate isomerase/epimerase [Chthonomonadaceae bacterium]|nr:sugar phosphate isomerase/epimerase [Chthonomonadaceae bacterium]